MPNWEIEARGEATEYYNIEADTEEEARAKFESGDSGFAFYTEVSGSEIKTIKESNA